MKAFNHLIKLANNFEFKIKKISQIVEDPKSVVADAVFRDLISRKDENSFIKFLQKAGRF